MQRVTVLLAIAVVALQCCFVSQAAARQLLACTTIPKCDGKCIPDTVLGGTGDMICTKCATGYVRWNKGKACVCPRGQYDTGAGCAACGTGGHYCPGVARSYVSSASETAADRGEQLDCDKSGNGTLTTLTGNTIHWYNCVAKPGYKLASTDSGNITESTQTGVQCTDDTYNVGYNRLETCRPCKPGLGMESGNTAAIYHDSETDCKVKPGYMWDSEVDRARACLKGSYRANFLARSAALATRCVSCGTGISTNNSTSEAQTDCVVVQPGYQALWNAGNYAYGATECGYGTYWPGGVVSAASTCTSCGGYTTKDTGSTQLADCMAPPGYYLPTGASPALTPCPTNISAATYGISNSYGNFGTYRPLWATTPNGVKDCKVCGAAVLSAAKHKNEHPTDTALVAAAADACYIEAGEALNIDYSLTANISRWRKTTCNADAFGATNRTYGLEALVCKPCGRNLVKNTRDGVDRHSLEACVNPEGYGMAADGTYAERCPIGSWAAAGSLLRCTACTSGRTTVYNTTQQKAVTDCFVVDGYGVYLQNGTTDAAKWYETGLPTNETDLAALQVNICPVGRYSSSTDSWGEVGAVCTACPTNSVTESEGSTDQANCTVCLSGTGRNASTAYGECSDCGRGTFNDGSFISIVDGTTRANWQCLACPAKVFPYIGQDDLTSESTTKDDGSIAVHACVPINNQISSSAGTTLFDGYYNGTELVKQASVTTFTGCVDACAAAAACHFSEFRYNNTNNTAGGYDTGCFLFTPANGTGEIYYKLTPTLTTDQVTVASLASSMYAKHTFDTGIIIAWGDTIDNFSTAAAAAASCDGKFACWGFVSVNSTSFETKTGTDYPLLRTVVNAMKTAETVSPSAIIVQP